MSNSEEVDLPFSFSYEGLCTMFMYLDVQGLSLCISLVV